MSKTEYLPFEVEQQYVKLLQRELKLHGDMEKLKQELAARYDYNLEHLFKVVDDWNYKYVDFNNLKRFLIKTGVVPTDSQLVAILRRFDLDADAKLSRKEFMEGVKPIEEYSKRSVKQNIEGSKVVKSPGYLASGRKSKKLSSSHFSSSSKSVSKSNRKRTLADEESMGSSNLYKSS